MEWSTRNCIGALTLQAALAGKFPKERISWGRYTGRQNIGKGVVVGTEENINMMRVTYPQEVTFIIP